MSAILKFFRGLHPFYIPKVMGRLEKFICAVLILVILAGVGMLSRRYYLQHTHAIPKPGGTYIEGWVANSNSDLSESLASLTHVGLTRLGTDGSIQPALAKSWQVSPDSKVYTFTLKSNISSYKLAPYIREQKGSWLDVNVVTVDMQTLQITLKKSYGMFLASTLSPIFPYGPFKIKNQSNKEIVLVHNPASPFHPYFQEIIFRLYADEESLTNDLQQGKIMGVGQDITTIPRHFRAYELPLPKYEIAFFNTAKGALSHVETRQQLIKGTPFAKPLTLTLYSADTNTARNFTESLKTQWGARNVTVKDKIFDPVTLISKEAPKKQYDVLVYSQNTGYYNDLYPYWHSSQQLPKGMNYSGVTNLRLDRAIEAARQTSDSQQRQQKLTEAQNIINTEAYALIQKSPPDKFFVRDNVKGIKVKFAVLPSDRLTFADKWYIKTKRVAKKKK